MSPSPSPLRLPFKTAVKTGTSSDFRDNWCIGFTRDLTVGVWVGNFDNSPLRGVSGVSGAGPIFHRTMLALHEKREPRWLQRPSGILDLFTDSRTGHRFPENPPAGDRGRPARDRGAADGGRKDDRAVVLADP